MAAPERRALLHGQSGSALPAAIARWHADSLEGRLLSRRGRLAVLEGKALKAADGAPVVEAVGSFMVEAAVV